MSFDDLFEAFFDAFLDSLWLVFPFAGMLFLCAAMTEPRDEYFGFENLLPPDPAEHARHELAKNVAHFFPLAMLGIFTVTGTLIEVERRKTEREQQNDGVAT